MTTARVAKELSKKESSEIEPTHFSEITKPLLAEDVGEEKKIAKAIQLLKYQINNIVSDPDYSDPVLGTNIKRHESLRGELAVLQDHHLYNLAISDNNAETYQAPTPR